ncbi:hypothetical protein SUDANB95_04680 [Actinosynnema sp. ALI-1.44]
MNADLSRVDQVVYRWSARSLLGRRGVGPVASSSPPDALDQWDQRLHELVWAAPGPPGLVFLDFDGVKVLIHKEDVPDANGREGSALAHVLIGRSLNAWHALGLSTWDGWSGEGDEVPEELPALHAGWLHAAAEQGLWALRGSVRDLSPALVADFVATLLAEPGAALTVVDPPAPPAELLCAWLDITGEPLTFATAEPGDTGRHLPRVVFRTAASGFSTHATTRTRVRLGGPREANPLRHFTFALAGRYARRGYEGMTALLPAQPLATAADVEAWARRVQFKPGVLADVMDLLSRSTKGELTPVEEDVLRSGVVDEHIVEQIRQTPDGELANTLVDVQANGSATARASEHRMLGELVRRMATRPLSERARQLVPFLRFDSTTLVNELARTKPVAHGVDSWRELVAFVGLLTTFSLTDERCLGLVARATSRLQTATLVRWLHEDGGREPATCELVLRSLPGRKGSGEQRKHAREAFLLGNALANVVDVLRPQSASAAVPLYDVLVGVVFGPDLGSARIIGDVLELLPPDAPPALLHVLYTRADNARVRRLVADAAARRYFEGNGLADR